jgi:hypothetical protein
VLTEDAVINLLCEHLTADGWKIVSKALPDQRGTDVVATRAGVRLEVEAKGEGSSKAHTASRSIRRKRGSMSGRQYLRLSRS